MVNGEESCVLCEHAERPLPSLGGWRAQLYGHGKRQMGPIQSPNRKHEPG